MEMADSTLAKMKEFAETKKAPEAKPLNEVEAVALDIARYRSHIQAVADIDRDLRSLTQKVADLDKQREAMIAQSLSMRDGIVLFTAEAREQVNVLMQKHGLTQEEVNALAKVPEAFAYVRLEHMVPTRVGDAIRAKQAECEPPSSKS